jgi:hypothetical protein
MRFVSLDHIGFQQILSASHPIELKEQPHLVDDSVDVAQFFLQLTTPSRVPYWLLPLTLYGPLFASKSSEWTDGIARALNAF